MIASTTVSTEKPTRGRKAVSDRLLAAAVELMSDRSPQEISGRELASAAGVNYGLIHHYFGSKDAVFARAAKDATNEMGQRWDRDGILPVNTSDEARSYRVLAKLDAHEARRLISSLTRRIADGHSATTGRPLNDSELLAEVALCAALHFGWGAFEDEILNGLSPLGAEREALRQRVAELSRRLAGE